MARAVDCKSITKKHRWFESTPAHFPHKSVCRSEDNQSLMRILRQAKAVQERARNPVLMVISPASLRDRTVGYGPTNRRSNRLLETLLVYRDKQGGVMTTIPIRKFWHHLYVSQNGARAVIAQ